MGPFMSDPAGAVAVDCGSESFSFLLLDLDEERRDFIEEMISNLWKQKREKDAQAGMHAIMMAMLSSTMLAGL